MKAVMSPSKATAAAVALSMKCATPVRLRVRNWMVTSKALANTIAFSMKCATPQITHVFVITVDVGESSTGGRVSTIAVAEKHLRSSLAAAVMQARQQETVFPVAVRMKGVGTATETGTRLSAERASAERETDVGDFDAPGELRDRVVHANPGDEIDRHENVPEL
eukprot:gene1668-2315_t